jgi:ABC-type sugar transport system permease subunit
MRTFAFYEAGKGAAMAILMFLMLAAASAIYFRVWKREENL